MRCLHTSDWHLGHLLINRDRKKEHRLFLDWLLKLIEDEKIDVLIVAGDIFDTSTPPNYAQELYYTFLAKVSKISTVTVVITGGNHDSVSVLNAPKKLLSHLNIHVVGGVTENIEDQIIRIADSKNGGLKGIVCAVPYLRERDVRRSSPGETYQSKEQAYLAGIINHYDNIREKAFDIRNQSKCNDIPVCVTGHFFITGSQTASSERDLHVGALGEIPINTLPDDFDYYALGHLHRPQKVAHYDHIRYSGSPIPLSFSELNYDKQVILVDFKGGTPVVESITVPVFQQMKMIKGNLKHIETELLNLKKSKSNETISVEVQIENEQKLSTHHSFVNEMVKDSQIEILVVKYIEDKDSLKSRGSNEHNTLTLEELKPIDIFNIFLSHKDKIPDDEKIELRQSFKEITLKIHDRD